MSALFSAPRALTVRSPAIPVLAGQPALVPLKLEGVEGINRLFEYKLILQTPDALNYMGGTASNFDLTSWVGLELTCFMELEGQGSFVVGLPGGSGAANQGAGVREISGLITAVQLIGEESRHALYEVTLRPWLHIATLNADCRVFQDQTVVEVIDQILTGYPFAAEKRLVEKYKQVDYQVQYNESDFEFISRLMQENGINYHFAHSGGVHRLIWSDHNSAFQVTQEDAGKGVSAYHQIPFYPLGHKIDREYIHGFGSKQTITSGSYATREYAPWFGRGFLQLTHPGNYFAYWEWRGRSVNAALKQSILAVAAAEGVKHPNQRNLTALHDSNFAGMTQTIKDWRAEVNGGARSESDEEKLAPSDSAGFYWIKMMIRYSDASHVLERVSVATVDAHGNPTGNKIYYRSPTFWKVSASVNLPSAVNHTNYSGINGFDSRCSAYGSALAVLSEMGFPTASGTASEYPEDYMPRR